MQNKWVTLFSCVNSSQMRWIKHRVSDFHIYRLHAKCSDEIVFAFCHWQLSVSSLSDDAISLRITYRTLPPYAIIF